MNQLIMKKIDTVAEKLASTYADNPIQAAFIFDRIFLRPCAFDLKPERQFVVVDEDCGKEIGADVREIHKQYLSLDSTAKNSLKNYGQDKFIKEFNKFGINFLEHYTPNNKSNVILVSFDAIVGRLNLGNSSASAFEINIGGKKIADTNHNFNNFSSLFDNLSVGTRVTPRASQKAAAVGFIIEKEPEENKAEKAKDKQIKAYQNQFRNEVIAKYFGQCGTVIMSACERQLCEVKNDILTLTFQAKLLMGKNAYEKDVTFKDINETKTINLKPVVEEKSEVRLGK